MAADDSSPPHAPAPTAVVHDAGTLEDRFGDLASLWPAWEAERVLHESADLVVVDKPAGVSTHAPELGGTADVVSRLTRRYAEQGADPYLGIHQRLDRDTSGVLLFARRKSANASLARQFEGRTVEKTYLAIVSSRLRVPPGGVVEHAIREGEAGRMIAEDPRRGRPGGKLARTRLRILERRGERALVEACPETGRTHQIRVQLAALGAPIDGDVLYGGAPAARLMLHAQKLSLDDPRGKRVTFEAPIPRALRDHLAGVLATLPPDVDALAARLRDAAALRYPIATSGATEVLRLANGAGDALPGVAVDAYGPWLVVSVDGEVDDEARVRVLDAAHALGPQGVYVKIRPKHASVVVDTRREAVAPPHAVRGVDAPDPMVVRENGLAFEVRLGDGLSTGLFLDMRAQRARVREASRGARVLNLFSYTGSFTVAAIAGGATHTTTVDVARTVLTWAERNLARNGVAPSVDHVFVDADVLPWLDAQAVKKQTWDLIVLDPPSFSTTKASRFAVDGGYRDLVARAMRVASPEGRLLCCTNHRGVVQAKVRRWIYEAARDAGRRVEKLRDLPPPADFPPVPGQEPHLKVLACTLGEGAPEEARRQPPPPRRGPPR